MRRAAEYDAWQREHLGKMEKERLGVADAKSRKVLVGVEVHRLEKLCLEDEAVEWWRRGLAVE